MNPDMLENITLADAYDIVLEDLRKAENKISLLKQRLATAESELEEIKSRYAEDMKYIGGIVEKGTGNKLIGNIPIRLQLLGYVKSVEIVNLRRCHTEAKLLEVIKLFYRKHVLNDESIGWDELGNNLYNELAETLGDKEFCKWLDTQSMSK